MFASVIPGEYMSGKSFLNYFCKLQNRAIDAKTFAGYVQGQIQFPNWLGKNSKHNKFDRIMQELQMHTRLRYIFRL